MAGLTLSGNKVKKTSKVSRTFKIVATLVFAILVVVAMNFYASMNLKDTIEIVKLTSAVPQDGVVAQANMYKDTMLRSEYEKQGVYTLSDGTKRRSIVLWEDKDRIKTAFASYYIRQDTPLYWDALSKETPKQYAYLYQMDGELLKLKLDASEFGKMLVPGDKVNVRVTYSEKDFTLPTEREFQLQQQTGVQAQTSITKNELLFTDLVVLDLLNSKGESIFDIYYQLVSLPKAKQQEMVNTEDFQDKVKPSQILVNLTYEEANRYNEITGKSPSYMMTLLPRTSGNLITEALNSLKIGVAR